MLNSQKGQAATESNTQTGSGEESLSPSTHGGAKQEEPIEDTWGTPFLPSDTTLVVRQGSVSEVVQSIERRMGRLGKVLPSASQGLKPTPPGAPQPSPPALPPGDPSLGSAEGSAEGYTEGSAGGSAEGYPEGSAEGYAQRPPGGSPRGISEMPPEEGLEPSNSKSVESEGLVTRAIAVTVVSEAMGEPEESPKLPGKHKLLLGN